MHGLILADGGRPTRAGLDARWPGWREGVSLVVAADGGARHADALGVGIDVWVGDGDSLGVDGVEALVAGGVAVERADPDKDESDTELAVMAAVARGATRLTIVGALGGPRIDHALANVALLALDVLGGFDVRLVADDARVRLVRAPEPDGSLAIVELTGAVGDLVSLLPLGGSVVGVRTSGLRYPLRDEPLHEGRTRGLSNIRVDATATVSVRSGRVVIIESPATL
jgi:thiamine pyrophosphokinase